MKTQTLTIGNKRFVVVPERDFLRLQKQAAKIAVRSEFAQEAMQQLRAYRKNGKAANWAEVRRKLGL